MLFTPQSVSNAIAAIANELEGVVQQVASQAGASQQVVQEITAAIDGLKSAASALAGAEGSSQAQPILQRIEADAEAVFSVLATLPLPSPAAMVMRIAQVLLPTAIAAANMIWPPKASSGAPPMSNPSPSTAQGAPARAPNEANVVRTGAGPMQEQPSAQQPTTQVREEDSHKDEEPKPEGQQP